jgi:uncharacterized membrane protein YkvI
LLLRFLFTSTGSLFLFPFSFDFWQSASFMSGLVLVILLLQRLGVIINIYSVLIYFLYRKIMFDSTISTTKDDTKDDPLSKDIYIYIYIFGDAT